MPTITPIQSAIAGETVQQSVQVTYASNVVSGDLLLALVWWYLSADGVFTVSDDQGNTYTEDVGQSFQYNPGGTPFNNWLRCSIFSAVSGTGGVRPTVTANAPSGGAGVIGAICVQEYGPPSSPRSGGTGSAFEDGSGFTTNPTTSLTTTAANELLVDFAALINGQVTGQGTGWTLHDDWPNDAYIAYKTSGATGSYTADMTGVIHGGIMAWVIVVAGYKFPTGINYTDSITLGTASGLSDSVANSIVQSLPLGMTASDVPLGSGAFSQTLLMGLIQSFAEILQGNWLGVAQFSQGYAEVNLPSVAYTYPVAMALAEVIATSVLVSISGISGLGILSHLADIGNDDTSAAASLGQALGVLTLGQRAFIDSLAFGILQGLTADSGKAIVDVITFTGILGNNAVPAYQGRGIASEGVGILTAPVVNNNFSAIAALAYLLATQADTGSKALEAILGLAIGTALAAKPGILLQGSISLRDVYLLFDSLPAGLLPGLATVFAQLVYKSALSDTSGSATLSAQKVYKGEVSDI